MPIVQAQRKAEFDAEHGVKVTLLHDHDYTYSLDLLAEARLLFKVTRTLILNPRLPLHQQSLMAMDTDWRRDFDAYLTQLAFYEDNPK